MRARSLAFAAFAAALFIPSLASAYCRTTTCTPSTCVPSADCAYCMEGGLPLYWPGGCASFSVQWDGSPLRGISATVTRDLVENAFGKWIGVDCGGGSPSVALYKTDNVVCNKQEYNQDSGNANIWMYRDDGWPYVSSAATLALTTVTYNVKTGEIFDADVEINSADNPITVGDDQVQFDLDSIITHESGHFLGLAHSCDQLATMFVSYKLGDTALRSLEADDINGICAIYPPGKDVSNCDPTPRHGFATECGSPPAEKGCCTTAPGTPSRSGSAAVLALLAGLALGSARRRRRRR
jgi:hypothetical protein